MLTKLFLSHPRSIDESYFEHARVALTFAGVLAYAAFAALMHAIVPAFFEKTASRLIVELYQKTSNRG